MRILFSVTGSAAVLILFCMILRALCARRLPAAFYRAVWILAAVRLLVFAEIPSPVSIFALGGTASDTIGYSNTGAWYAVIPLTETAAASSAEAPFPWIFAIWLVGVCLMSALFLIPHLRFCLRMRSAAEITHAGQRVRISPHVRIPCAVGIFRPVICLGQMPHEYAPETLRCIFAHENAHIRRGDIPVKWLFAAALTLHWFNPLVWGMYILACRDLEFACDEAVLRVIGNDTDARARYAGVLLDLADRHMFMPTAAGMVGKPFAGKSRNTTKERILRMIQPKKTSRILLILTTVLCLAITAVLASAPMDSHGTSNPSDLPASDAPILLPDTADSPLPPASPTEEMPQTSTQISLIFPLPADSTWEITRPFGDAVYTPERVNEEPPFYYLGRIPESQPTPPDVFLVVSNHDGVDIAAAQGTPVLAVADGTVLEASYDYMKGNYIVLDLGGVIAEYWHLERFYAFAGDTVKQGDHIADLGYTGNATGPHLHFMLTVNGEAIDPMQYYTPAA